MVYCSNCGLKIDDEAYFCPKCGAKTLKGKDAKVNYPTAEIRDAFYQLGFELEKAFTIAARETHSALKKASEDLQGKSFTTTAISSVTCQKCRAKNLDNSIFCFSCGNRITPPKESHGST